LSVARKTLIFLYFQKYRYLTLSFNRPGFQEMEKLIESGKVSTVVVKDLSRFGREHLLCGHYTEIVYPSLGVNFIAIQENVDTTKGVGTEMMPFHNIFNEWYAAQTSKKIRAVNEMKAAKGKRVSSTVAYGYKKIDGDKEQWYIDEPAAEVVRKIYDLCLSGKGPSQIARQLEQEKILTPTAYFNSVGRKTSNPMPANIYGWRENSVEHILENRQYTGCTVNGKSTTVSYKVHKVIEKSKEDYQIIPNTQEAIISENAWLRVQELRKNKRRNTATGRKSLFSGLVFCADCGSKLHFCAAKSLKKNQEFFRCANYKDGRGTCTIHYIRDVVLEQIVTEAISELADFIRCYNNVFTYLLAEKKGADVKKQQILLKSQIENGKARITELDKLFSRIYEDNILGKLSDERYSRMANEYESEQSQLTIDVAKSEKELVELQKQTVDMKMLYQGLMEFTEMKQLTPTVVNKLIERIEIHNNEKKHSHNNVKVDIYFTAVGLFDIPSEQKLIETMNKIQEQNKSDEKSA
jgi:site-specific DNA recombinase